MEKFKSDADNLNFGISEILKTVDSIDYLEEEKDFSYEIIKKIDFNSTESVKNFLKEFTQAFSNVNDASYTVQTFCSEIIYEFLKNRNNINFLDDPEMGELFQKILETQDSLQNKKNIV